MAQQTILGGSGILWGDEKVKINSNYDELYLQAFTTLGTAADVVHSTLNATGANGLSAGTAGSLGGNLNLKSPSTAYYFDIAAGAFTENHKWILPLAYPTMDDAYLTISTAGVTAYANAQPHGEMYIYDSSTATVINVTDQYHALVGFTTGLVHDFTFVDGTVGGGNITTAAAGAAINIADVAHGLVSGDYVTVQSANHEGLATASYVDDDNFTVPITYVGDEVGYWQQGAYLQAAKEGTFRLALSLSGNAAAAAKEFKWELAHNDNELNNTGVKRSVSANYGAMPASGFVQLSVGDRVYIIMKNLTDSVNFTVEYANLGVFRI